MIVVALHKTDTKLGKLRNIIVKGIPGKYQYQQIKSMAYVQKQIVIVMTGKLDQIYIYNSGKYVNVFPF